MCGDDEQGMELAVGTPREGSETVGQSLPRELFTAQVSDKELDEIQRQEDRRRGRIERLPIHAMAHGVLRWVDRLKSQRDATARPVDRVLFEALDVVSWDVWLIPAKVHRALDGRDRFQHGDSDCDEDRIQNDWNGSAKVALISLERSASAWHVIAAATGDADAMSFAADAEMLHKAIVEEFPNAMSFIRPGFDDGRLSAQDEL